MTTRRTERIAADNDTRRLAQTEFARPLVVEAGAGTGKTTLLVARVAAWCVGPGWERHAGDDAEDRAIARRVIERVVAITFTEAAAAEMARRISDAFGMLSRGGELEGFAVTTGSAANGDVTRARAAALAGEVHRLTVSTIHAFCQRLLAAHPIEAGLHPRFEVDPEEALLQALVEEVVEDALRNLDADPQVADWETLAASGVDPPAIGQVLEALVTAGAVSADLDRDPFTAKAAAAAAENLAAALRRFSSAEGGLLAGLATNATVSIRTRNLIDQLAADFAALHDQPGFSRLAALVDDWDKKSIERLEDWAADDLKSTERKCLGEAAPGFAESASALMESIRPLIGLEVAELDAARRVLSPLLAEVEARRSTVGLITYGDLLSRAARLLENSPDTLDEVCAAIDQLLVDEFQDTDRVQCRLVERLAFGAATRPGLFVVGDPKQSIYAWRNADLSAYRDFVAVVLEQDGSVAPLVQNFRSHQPILDEVDRALRPVMRFVDGVQPPFEPLEATGDRVGSAGYSDGLRSAVERWVTWPPPEDGKELGPARSDPTTRFEAEVIASDIADLCRDGSVGWGKVAVLLRASTAQEELLQAFRERGVPFEVSRERSFYRQREILEAAALIRCVLEPTDMIALLTVLRSEAVGVPDRALAPLWDAGLPSAIVQLDRPDPGALEEVEGCIVRAEAATPTDTPDAGTLQRWPVSLSAAVALVAELREAYACEPPDRFVERIRTRWLAEVSASARFLGRFRRARLERFYADLEELLGRSAGSNAETARFLRRAVGEGDDSAIAGEPDLEASRVHVMTVHGAKGLDFEHVYLMQVHRQFAHNDRAGEPLILPTEHGFEYRLFGWPTPDLAAEARRKQMQERAEAIRLLYVAMTRAKSRLVVSGGWTDKAPPDDPLRARSFAELLAGLDAPGSVAGQTECRRASGEPDEVGVQWVLPAVGSNTDEQKQLADGPSLLRIDIDRVRGDAAFLAESRRAALNRMARPFGGGVAMQSHLRAARDEAEDDDPVPGGSSDAAMAAGSAVHELLETLDLGRNLREQVASRIEQVVAAARRGLAPRDGNAAELRCRAVVEVLMEGDCLLRLHSLADVVVARELAVVVEPEDDEGPVGFISGLVDLVYRDPDDGRLVVADYKTDRVHDDEGLEERRAFYEPQVRTYARALRQALALDHEPHTELWFLEADRIVRF